MDASAGFGGDLTLRINGQTHNVPPHVAEWLKEIGHDAKTLGNWFSSSLAADHYRPHPKGKHIAGVHFGDESHSLYGTPHKLLNHRELGSGLVTNVGVMALANDFAWAQNAQTLKLSNWHASGTGTTAAAATDIALQTSAGPSPVAGTQTLVSAANSQTYKTVATLTYGSALAITEWGLHTSGTLSATTGTPLTAVSTTSATVTGTPYTASSASVQGEQQFIIKTGTTASYMLILSNTTSVLTGPAWYKTADGTAGTTPGATEAFTLLPVMWDRKVFAPINVVNTDTIQYSYSLLCSSGG